MRSLHFLSTAKSCSNSIFSGNLGIRSGGIFRNSCFLKLNNSGIVARRRMSTSSQGGGGGGRTFTTPTTPSRVVEPFSTNTSKEEDEAFLLSPIFPTSSSAKIETNIRKEQEEKEEVLIQDWKWLEDYGPGFPVPGKSVKIIHSPDQFYSQLVERAKNAQRRVSLASLYLGSGPQETELVQVLEKNGIENSNLKVKVLLDFTRGSRGLEVSSRTMLLPLINKCHDCRVFLYHTPQLRGLKKRWLPQRWNEVIGLQHMKIYIFDDSIIISGANLSGDYFTNRQDRYFLIENCKELADFYDQLIDRVCDFSFQLDKSNSANLKPNWTVHPSEGDLDTFVKEAKEHVLSYYNECKKENISRLVSFQSTKSLNSSAVEDTWIFPLIQMGGIGISFDKDATCHIFENSPQGSHIKLATGYFNLTSEYIHKIIQNSSTSYEILMAHPKANGFFGAKGFAGGIPAAYTLLAKQFLDNADSDKQMYRLSMSEYLRPGWTYHAKGLWFYQSAHQSSLPTATLIGSPNFGHRSVYRDLETQLYIITTNPKLRQQLQEEQSHLFSFSKPFVTTELSQPNRTVPLWVRFVVMFFRNFF